LFVKGQRGNVSSSRTKTPLQKYFHGFVTREWGGGGNVHGELTADQKKGT